MRRLALDVLVSGAVLLAAAALTAPAARAQSVPGMPEPGEATQPAGAGSTPAESTVMADTDPDQATVPDEPAPGWVILPGVQYTPERGLTVAAALLRYFRLRDGPKARLSRIGLQAAVSFEKRAEVNFDPSLWMFGDRFNLAGTMGVSYFDYPYYGIGNDTLAQDREDFTAVRVSTRIEAAARMWRSLLGGLLYEFRYEDITDVTEGGELDMGVVGSQGGFLSGVGGILRWDSRDHSFAPRSGGLITFSPRIYRRGLGSDYDFGRLLFDGNWFFGLGGAHVIGVDARADFRTGEPPFDHLSLAGGPRLLRGMIEGRFRDNHFVGAQVEYRFPIYWRFGGVAFGGAGRVADRVRDFAFEGMKLAGGGGLRFAVNRDERINLRFDAGATAEDFNVYLGIGEAF